MKLKTADLCDRYSSELQVVRPSQFPFRSYGRKKSFSGPIVTVDVLEDNVLVKKAIETIPAGSVLVVDGHGSDKCALLGDRLAGIAVSRGISGIIINGYVRDSDELPDMDLGVLALGSMPLKSKKEGKGKEQVTLNFGGVEWKPGDYVYADEDGVVIATRELTLD
ncbi:MAG: ribonuclease E activity regulator RraA [Bacillaceae bacterium]|nr:ribonuclease E activity regulator RraA [Bacillaceae bacterium]